MSVSGLALHIRNSTESDTFDLAGQNVTTVTTNIEQAFREALPIHDTMIRLTFITGAGKLGRSKYDENCAKAVTAALRSVGYEDDRTASCVIECAGSFKLQHDTGKNLKTVVVFPKIATTSERDNGDGGGCGKNNQNITKNTENLLLFQPGSPEEMIALSPMTHFSMMIKTKCVSWSSKKYVASILVKIESKISDLEHRLMEGEALDDNEQKFYDDISIDELKEKHKIVKNLMLAHFEADGNITADEKDTLLEQVANRLAVITNDLNEAKIEKKPKKVTKLMTAKLKLDERETMLKKLNPKPPQALKHQKSIEKLQTELIPLIKLEDATKGRLLSVKETKTLARKDEILEEIEQLEDTSRGWFEEDASFELRVLLSRKMSQSKAGRKQSAGNKKTNTTSKKSTGNVNSWISSSTASKPKPYKTSAAKKKSTGSGGGIFAAMMLDDSDSN